MEIHRSIGVSFLVACLAAHRGGSPHDRTLASHERSVADAREPSEPAAEFRRDEMVPARPFWHGWRL